MQNPPPSLRNMKNDKLTACLKRTYLRSCRNTRFLFFAIVSDDMLSELHTCLQPSLFLFHYNEDYTLTSKVFCHYAILQNHCNLCVIIKMTHNSSTYFFFIHIHSPSTCHTMNEKKSQRGNYFIFK